LIVHLCETVVQRRPYSVPEDCYHRLVILIPIFALTLASVALMQAGDVRRIAHRGGVVSEQLAENSPSSLEEAIKRGFWMIEVDVRESKDGKLVVHHDPDFKRYYGVERNVADLSWAEIENCVRLPETHVL
jgi:glycerophosphoryl diester phosphodiesterase